MRSRRTTLLRLALVLPAILAGSAVRAQGCDTVSSRTSLASLSGRRVASVRIVTESPSSLPGPAALLDRLHVRTRERTVRRELLVAAGDTVDTLRVAESLRRLRRLRFLTDPEVRATNCGGPVSLTVVTRDLWSTRPSVKVRSASAAFEVRERNLLGTGRQASLGVRSDRGRIGIGATLRDPGAFGDRLAMELGANRYKDGDEWFATAGRRERSLHDPWGFQAYLEQSSRIPVADAASSGTAAVPGEAFRRGRAGVLAWREVRTSGAAVTSLQAGVEYERASLVAGPHTLRLGPEQVRREIAAIDFGVRRRSAAFDTLTWLLPADAVVDVPLAFELDALAGVGREMAGGTPVVHLDAWGGKMWHPAPGALLVADLWVSGFRSPGRWSAGTLRGNLALHHAAPRGLWTARLGGEWLFDPDPDLRAMVTADPTAGALRSEGRLAEAAIALSVERDLRIRRLTRSWALDGAAFGAASTRWDPVATPTGAPAPASRAGEGALERVDLGVVGVGLRLTPTRLGRATARLDLGYPVMRSAGVPARPFIALSISPWLEQGRGRSATEEP